LLESLNDKPPARSRLRPVDLPDIPNPFQPMMQFPSRAIAPSSPPRGAFPRLLRKLFRALFLLGVIHVPCTSAHGDSVIFSVPLEIAGDSVSLYTSPENIQLPLSFWAYNSGAQTFEYAAEIDGANPPSGYLLQNNTTSWSTWVYPGQTPSMWDLTIDSGGVADFPISFAIPEDRLGHVLMIEMNGQGFTLGATSGIFGTEVPDGNGGFTWQSYGFFTARGYVPYAFGDPRNQWFRVLDISTSEAAGWSVTNLIEGNWNQISTPMTTATVFVPDQSGNYTFVTGSGSWQSLYPNYDGSSYYVEGTIAWNDTFWVIRDIDGQTSSVFQAGATAISVSSGLNPYVSRNLQWHSFLIGESSVGRQLGISHPDGYQIQLQPDWGSWGSNYTTYWDDNGEPHDYHYYYFNAETDDSQAWWLADLQTGENFGYRFDLDTAVPGHLSQPGWFTIEIAASRVGHALRITQTNGEEWNLSMDPYNANIQVTGTYLNWGTPQERWYDVNYAIMRVPSTGPVSMLTDGTTGESVSLDSGDLRQWYLAPQPRMVRLHASRWFNSLYLVYPPNEQVLLDNKVQTGSWELNTTQPFFTADFVFTASQLAPPDAPWWIWDSTRGEYLSSVNDESDFSSDIDDTDANGNLVPDWWETAYGPGLRVIDSDGDGLSDFDELTRIQDGRITPLNRFSKDNPAVGLSVFGFTAP
jgi:hypothetical protein